MVLCACTTCSVGKAWDPSQQWEATLKNPQSGQNRPTYDSVDEFASAVGISRAAAYNGLRNGRIPHIRLGKRYVIPKAAIDDWLRNAGGPTSNRIAVS